MKLLAFLLLLPALAFAQKKETKTEKGDTLSSDLKETELAILDQYAKQYNALQQQMQQQAQLMQNELKNIEINYQNVLRMKVEAVGGDSKKWCIVKDKKIYYLK